MTPTKRTRLLHWELRSSIWKNLSFAWKNVVTLEIAHHTSCLLLVGGGELKLIHFTAFSQLQRLTMRVFWGKAIWNSHCTLCIPFLKEGIETHKWKAPLVWAIHLVRNSYLIPCLSTLFPTREKDQGEIRKHSISLMSYGTYFLGPESIRWKQSHHQPVPWSSSQIFGVFHSE